jgi:hypothetical protein
MPVRKVASGYKWGKSGKVYPTEAQAERQGRAIYASGYAGGGIASLGNETTERPASNGIYGLWKKHVPMDARIFLQTLLGTPGELITEEAFTSEELGDMEKVVQRAMRKDESRLRGDVQYGDYIEPSWVDDYIQSSLGSIGYKGAPDISGTGASYLETSPSKVRTTLGRFTYTTDPATGKRIIIDNYDFDEGASRSYETMTQVEKAKAVIRDILRSYKAHKELGVGISPLQMAAQQIGEAYIGRKGRPVRIAYDPTIEMSEDYRAGGIVYVTQGDDPSTVDRVRNFMDGINA